MADFKSRLLMRRPLLLVAILAAALVAMPMEASAEIILDEFDDPMQIILPGMEDITAETLGVGGLNAVRLVFVSESQTDPIGLVDVEATRPSHLTARIDGQSLDNPLNLPLLSIGVAYDFPLVTDLTDNGANDHLLIDMTIFQGIGIPGQLSVLIRDDAGIYASNISGFSLLSDLPYTLEIPFSSFGSRGGNDVADFSSIELLEVRVRLLTGSRILIHTGFFKLTAFAWAQSSQNRMRGCSA
jgi:hypothetical protein